MGVNGEKVRLPYMPFYVEDWLSSTAVAGFTLAQQGAYLRLLARQWQSPTGALPNDERELARISGLGPRWKTAGKPIIAKCFKVVPQGIQNLKLQAIRNEVLQRSEKARKSAEKRWTDDANA